MSTEKIKLEALRKAVKELPEIESMLIKPLIPEYEKLVIYFIKNYPDVTIEEANEIVTKLMTIVVRKIMQGETLAFLRYDRNGEIIINPYVLEHIGNKPHER